MSGSGPKLTTTKVVIIGVLVAAVVVVAVALSTSLRTTTKKKPHTNKKPHANKKPHHQPAFVETPFKYMPKKPIQRVCELHNGGKVNCRGAWSYQETLDKCDGIWDPGLYNDKSQSICKSWYDKDCRSSVDTECNVPPTDATGVCNLSNINYGANPNICCTTCEYAHATPHWNWVIGACIGTKCGASYGTPTKGMKNAKDIGTKTVVNYVGSYIYDEEAGEWHCQQESSFNMDGRHPPQDLMKFDQNWLPGPLPGGAADWGAGYYPAGRPGVGSPAFAFILSVDRVYNLAWYAINQAALNRGPAAQMAGECAACMTHHGYDDKQTKGIEEAGNTWASAMSGEWDFLESGWASTDLNNNKNYLKLFSNSGANQGANGTCLMHGRGTDGRQNIGGFDEKNLNFFVSDDVKADPTAINPRVFFCIVDRNGTTMYQIPVGDGDPVYWRGIGRKSASMSLPAKYTSATDPGIGNPTSTGFRMSFLPGCGAKNATNDETKKYGCTHISTDRGQCGNYLRTLASTGNVFGKTKAFGGLVEWTTEMEVPTPTT